MEPSSADLRILIRTKISDGRLAVDYVPRMSSGVGRGEPCLACDRPITELQMLMHGLLIEPATQMLRFHVRCFYLWEEARGALYL